MILIVGTGAVGSVLANQLALCGKPVSLYARPKDIDQFGSAPEIQLEFANSGKKTSRKVARPPLRETLDLNGINHLLLAIKARNILDLIGQLADSENLPGETGIISTLNGVEPLRQLRQAFPQNQVTPVSVMFNAQLRAPLHARLTTRPEIVVGDADRQTADLFRGADLDVRMAQGDTAVWGKLMINLANAICALTHSTFRDLFTQPDLRQVYVRVLDETVEALNAASTPWKLPLIVPFPVYRFLLLHGGPVPWWFAHYRNGVGDGAYPSMCADLQAGKATEVEELNGEIVRLGQQHGRATPANSRLVEMVRNHNGDPPLRPSELRSAILSAP